MNKVNIDWLDAIDNQILSCLKQDARMSYTTIGNTVGLSRVAVKNRIKALEENGVIEGYQTLINPYFQDKKRMFFVDLTTDPSMYDAVIDTLCHHEAVKKVYALTGECRSKLDCIAHFSKQYSYYIRHLKRNLEGIKYISVQDVQYEISFEKGDDNGKDEL